MKPIGHTGLSERAALRCLRLYRELQTAAQKGQTQRDYKVKGLAFPVWQETRLDLVSLLMAWTSHLAC